MSDAIMQWEIDRARYRALKKCSFLNDPQEARAGILHAVLDDVIRNGGTLVVVSTEDKITVVQRATADDDLDTEAPATPPTTPPTGGRETEGVP